MQSAHLARRCGAKTRAGTPCRSPAVKGKQRCRMHGGSSPGAPKGNRNAVKHGRYTTTRKIEHFKARQTLRELEQLIRLAVASKPDDA